MIARILKAYTGPVTVLIPRQAISIISAAGQPFHDPEADAALFGALTDELRNDIEVRSMDCEINDPVFARACANALLEFVRT